MTAMIITMMGIIIALGLISAIAVTVAQAADANVSTVYNY
jgi:hypothetical protein